MNYGDGPAWRDAAERSLDAMHERAERAEKQAEALVEALERIGWRSYNRDEMRFLARSALSHYKGQGQAKA